MNKSKKDGVQVYGSIPKCDYIFNGGKFTKIAEYLRRYSCKAIVANGGFVGCNIMKNPLSKFKGKKYIRTFNFNMDVSSIDYILKSKNYENMYLIGKNVCHDDRNIKDDIWKDFEFLNKYHLKHDKKLHDLLVVREGLNLINNNTDALFVNMKQIKCINTGLFIHRVGL